MKALKLRAERARKVRPVRQVRPQETDRSAAWFPADFLRRGPCILVNVEDDDFRARAVETGRHASAQAAARAGYDRLLAG